MGRVEDFWGKDPSHEDVRYLYKHPACRKLEGNFKKLFTNLTDSLVVKENSAEIWGLVSKIEGLRDSGPDILKEILKKSWRTREFPNIRAEAMGRVYQGDIEGIDEWVEGYPHFSPGVVLVKNPDRKAGVEDRYGFRNGITILEREQLILACEIKEGKLVVRRPVQQHYQREFRDPLLNTFSQFKIEDIPLL